jgi:hypothetical protein
MSLASKISTIIQTAYPDATFILSSKFKANVASFDIPAAELPLIILNNELSAEAEIKKNNNISLNRRVVISFFALDSVENTDAQSFAIQESMEQIAVYIAAIIWQLPEIVPVGGNQKFKITPEFHVFNTNLTGVTLDMNANEITQSNICVI